MFTLIVICVTLIGILFALLYDDGILASLSNGILPKLSSKIAAWNVKRLSFMRGYLRGLNMRFQSNGDDIAIEVQFASLQVRIMEWITTGFTTKPMHLEFQNLVIHAALVDLVKDKNEPAAKAQASRTMQLWISRLCSFKIEHMDIRLDLLDLSTRVQIRTDEMFVRGHQCVQALNRCGFDIKSAPMSVTMWDGIRDDTPPVLAIKLDAYSLKFDLSVYSKELFFTLSECTLARMETDARHMLEVYKRFVEMEDTAIETLGRTEYLPKLMALHLNIQLLQIGLRDGEMDQKLLVSAQNCVVDNVIKAAGLQKSMQTRVAAQSFAFEFDDETEEHKESELARKSFLAMTSFQMSRQQTTPFDETAPEEEHIDLTAEKLETGLGVAEMEWLLFPTLLTKLLPVSRHAHPKKSEMFIEFSKASLDCDAFQDKMHGASVAMLADTLTINRIEEPHTAGSKVHVLANTFSWSVLDTAAELLTWFPGLKHLHGDTRATWLTSVHVDAFSIELLVGDDTVFEGFSASKIVIDSGVKSESPFLSADHCRYSVSHTNGQHNSVKANAITGYMCSESILVFVSFIKSSMKFSDHMIAHRGELQRRFDIPEAEVAKQDSEVGGQATYACETLKLTFMLGPVCHIDWTLQQFLVKRTANITTISTLLAQILVNHVNQPFVLVDVLEVQIDDEQEFEAWKVVMGKLVLHPSTAMQLGTVIDVSLAQKNALMMAFEDPLVPKLAALKPSTMHVECDQFSMIFGAFFKKRYVSELIAMHFRTLTYDLDATLSQLEMIEQIQNFDDTAEQLVYDNIQGGRQSLHAAVLSYEIYGHQGSFFTLANFRVQGPGYAAQVADPRIEVVTESVPIYSLSIGRVAPEVCFGVVLTSNPTPMKMYGDVAFASTQVTIAYNYMIQESSLYVSYCSPLIMPENKDSSLALSLWDQFRYWIHGSYELNVGSMMVEYELASQRLDTARIDLGLEDVQVKFVRNHVQFESGCVTAYTPCEIATDEAVTHTNGLHQWLSIPKIGISCGHVWSSSNCHHTYLRPRVSADTFEEFRAVGVSWDINSTIGAVEGLESLIDLRLDLVTKLLVLSSDPLIVNIELHDSIPVLEPNPCTLQSITSSALISMDANHLKILAWGGLADYIALVGGSELLSIRLGMASLAQVPTLTGQTSQLELDQTSCTIERLVLTIDDHEQEYKRAWHSTSNYHKILRMLWDNFQAKRLSMSTLFRAQDVAIDYCIEEEIKSRAHSDISEASLVEADAPTDFHPTLTDFPLNHQMFKPPEDCIPPAERANARIRSPQRSRSVVYQSSVEAAAPRKQWNLTIQDSKLLWTITLRDRLFNFMTNAMQTLQPMQLATSKAEEPKHASTSSSLGSSHTRKESGGTLMEYLSRQDSTFANAQHPTVDLTRSNSARRRSTLLEMDMSRKLRSRGSSSDLSHVSRPSSARVASAGSAEIEPLMHEEMQQIVVFKINVVRPQINCLCEKTHCSFIIVAARAVVEDHRNAQALLYPSNPSPHVKHELSVRMEQIVAYIAPSDMYGSDAALWKGHDSEFINETPIGLEPPHIPLGRLDSSGSNTLLQEVVPEFNFTSSYVHFALDPPSPGSDPPKECNEDEDMVCQMFLDLPDFQIHLDSPQFFVFLNVVRNVLLAPPPMTAAAIQKRQAEMVQLEEAKAGIADLDLGSKSTREDVRDVLERNLDTITRQTAVAVEMQYFIAKGSWVLIGSNETERIEMSFNGLHGRHVFNVDGSADTIIELQRAWIRNLKPGADAALVFEDATSILTPIVHEPTGCARCGKHFIGDENDARSCRFHAFADGRHGEFKSERPGEQYLWTCCGQSWEGAPGCSARPHIFREHMFTMRAESYPTAVMRNVELSIFQHIEISIFPGVAYTLEIQITKTLADMLNKYLLVTATATTISTDRPGHDMGSDALLGNTNAPAAKSSLFNFRRPASIIPPPPPDSPVTPILSTPKSMTSRSDAIELEATHSEGVYLRYWRLGDINVQVSTAGFAINLDNYVASVPAFVRQRKLTTWLRFLGKIEYHATWSLTKSTATSGLAKIKARFGFSKANKNTGRAADDDDDVQETSRTSLLLGGKRAAK